MGICHESQRYFRLNVPVVPGSGDAYFRLAPPLLNRFEKQIFLRKDGKAGRGFSHGRRIVPVPIGQ